MTFADLYAEVDRLLASTTFCLSIEAWTFRHDDGKDSREVKYSVWDGTRSIEASTMDGLLVELREHLGRTAPPSPLPEITATDLDAIASRASAP